MMNTPEKSPTTQEAILIALMEHTDPAVVKCAKYLNSQHQSQKRSLLLVQETLQQIKMDIKYLAFDLEATRRERDALRAQL